MYILYFYGPSKDHSLCRHISILLTFLAASFKVFRLPAVACEFIIDSVSTSVFEQ